MNHCAGCVREPKCKRKDKNKGECKDKQKHEDTAKFRAYDHMMRQNKGIEGPT